MTVPADPRQRTMLRDDDLVGVFTPHSTNEGTGDSSEWLQEVLPVPSAAEPPHVHRDDHLPRGWHDFGAAGWIAVALMAVVLGLVVWGFVLPWLGITNAWTVDPLR